MRVTSETKTATRDRILEVAQAQFARGGFEATTTRDIAREAQIAVGTLFNYFPTKESIVVSLLGAAWTQAAETFAADGDEDAAQSLEEELFAQAAVLLRKLKPYRKYLPVALETALSPLAQQADQQPSLRQAHLETVGRILARHGHEEALSGVALHLYWTLLVGVLAFWAKDTSPRQESTLALLDQSLAMFVGWLSSPSDRENGAHTSSSLARRASGKER